jgi:hypothetical protein
MSGATSSSSQVSTNRHHARLRLLFVGVGMRSRDRRSDVFGSMMLFRGVVLNLMLVFNLIPLPPLTVARRLRLFAGLREQYRAFNAWASCR